LDECGHAISTIDVTGRNPECLESFIEWEKILFLISWLRRPGVVFSKA
jgi:hypothetical protein